MPLTGTQFAFSGMWATVLGRLDPNLRRTILSCAGRRDDARRSMWADRIRPTVRTALAGIALAASATGATLPSAAQADQIRIVHLDCEQWRARQALLAAWAARPHPPRVRPAHHSFHRPRVRVHYVCDCVEDGGGGGGGAAYNKGGVSGGGAAYSIGGVSGGGAPFQTTGDGFFAGGGWSGGGGSGGGATFPGFGGSTPTTPDGPVSVLPLDPGLPPILKPDPPPIDPGPIQPPAVPEPATWLLAGLGAAALAALRLRRATSVRPA